MINKRYETSPDSKASKVAEPAFQRITSHEEFEAYQLAYSAAQEIFTVSRKFPNEEKYSLTNQIRRSSRSVCANLAEAWRKRRYRAAFQAKLSDAEAEAAETQTWLNFSRDCSYLDSEIARRLIGEYDHVIGKLVNMIKSPENWLIRNG